MTLLSVNVNKIATLRNSRGTNLPDVGKVVKDLIDLGVRGITVHPRPDERHIKKSDVAEIQAIIDEHNAINDKGHTVEFNIEGYPSPEFMDMVFSVTPHQVTLVPDPPNVLTSNAGWKLHEHLEYLKTIVHQFQSKDIRCSLFIDVFDIVKSLEPNEINKGELNALKEISPQRVELYTEAFAKDFLSESKEQTAQFYKGCAESVLALGIELNAGHDLNQQNLSYFVSVIPELKEVSIGHALICEALYQGFPTTIANYHAILAGQ